MKNILTQIKINKIISTSIVAGISLMLFASIFSVMPTSSASTDLCFDIFGTSIFDSNFVFDSDTGDFIMVFKCFIPDVDCVVNDPNPNGFEEVPKKSTISSTCNGFGVVMFTSVDDAVLTDSVPAEWDAIGFSNLVGLCTEEVKGKNQQGATVYTCTPVLGIAAFSVALLETRESPGSGKGNQSIDKFKPTECILFKNDGAEGFVPDATFTNGVLNDVPVAAPGTPFSTGLTEKIQVTVVGPSCNG